MPKQIVLNRIRTPDGTILISPYKNCRNTHVDSLSNEKYWADGGTDVLLRSDNNTPYKEMSVYLDDTHKEIREGCYWSVRRNNGYEKLPLKKLTEYELNDILKAPAGLAKWRLLVTKNELQYRDKYKNMAVKYE